MIENIFSEQQINDQFAEYCNLLLSTNREGVGDLVNWLRNNTDMLIAPSSTKYHLCSPGGLVKHSLNVLNRLRALVKAEGLEEKYKDDTLIIAALCHDLCKVNYYEVYSRNVKNEETKQWEKEEFYRIKDDSERLIYGLHAENSVFIAQRFIILTYAEQISIRWHMGCLDWQDNDKMLSTMGSAYGKCSLAFLLHIADQMASYLDEKKE